MALVGRSPFPGRFERTDLAVALVVDEFFGASTSEIFPGGKVSTAVAGGAELTGATGGTIAVGGKSSTTALKGPLLTRGTARTLTVGGKPSTAVTGGVEIAAPHFLSPGGVPSTGTTGGAEVTSEAPGEITPGGKAPTGVAGGAALDSVLPPGVHPGGVPSTTQINSVVLTGGVTEEGALPPRVPETFRPLWESYTPTGSVAQVGAARPTMTVMLRTGRFWRRNAAWHGPPIDVTIHGLNNSKPWQSFWTAQPPAQAYREIPNVREIRLEQTLDQNGITSATITIDNIFYRPETAGHHSIKRGYFAPVRGYVAPGQAPIVDEQGETLAQNEWFGLLGRESQVTIFQGYGESQIEVFTGLIDDVDVTSRPDVITVTARDFGKILNDERVFGWNKDPKLKDPVIFIDKDEADDIDLVGSDADASSDLGPKWEAENVLDGDGDTSWVSNTHSVQAFTEYVEIRLPEGRYSDFRVSFGGAGGYEMYVSLNPKELEGGVNPTWGGEEVEPDEWISGDGSGDNVPGTHGGHNYLRLVTGTPLGPKHIYKLHPDGTDFKVGDNTLLRLSFRNLNLADTGPTPFGAIVVALNGRKRTLLPEAKEQKWIRVEDASDVVGQILRWAGFKEFEVDKAGLSLHKRFVVNRGMTYMDVIQRMKDLLGFTFFMGDPTKLSNSIGYPVFRKSLIYTDAPSVLTIDHHTMLNAIEIKRSDESLAYIIRVRGRESSNGKRLGGSKEKRIMFTFRPPWGYKIGSSTIDQLGGVIKHVIYEDKLFKTKDDVKFGAYYIALQEALTALQATVQIPGNPEPQLDDHVTVVDLATGVTGRLSVQARSSIFTRNADQSMWTMTYGGALVDEPEVTSMVAIINAALHH